MQAIRPVSTALPHARRAPTPRLFQSSLLSIRVRQPPTPDGAVVSPSRAPPSQVAPPSKDRSSHTWSPGREWSTTAQPIGSPSAKWSWRIRSSSAVVTAIRSLDAWSAARSSQYLSHTTMFAAGWGAFAWTGSSADIVVKVAVSMTRTAASPDPRSPERRSARDAVRVNQ
ncbi:hypothetical protein [Amycolatopsis rubida]|uniref:hypothetical protein n=1 Tax=Amycolatopsis rubida TaxID=112413 RepID=UPI0007E0E112|nr:hypothetical protein [Amycolatopsis rubida]OAP27013.1 hypothetical protein A4R44_03006 [Amycolatopsis sp. M39]